jgi:signal transduction histidine kinase
LRWLRIQAKGIPQKENPDFIDYANGIITDVTKLKQTEETLRKSEEKFRIAQEISPDGFTILQPVRNKKGEVHDFIWVYENDAIARVNGTDPKDVVGKSLLELFPSHRNTDVFKAYLYVANTGKTKIFEKVYVGEIISKPTWLRIVIVSMGDDIAILSQNITELVRAEQEIIQAKQKAEESNELKNIFLANMSHEIRTPMNAIVGFSDLLNQKGVNKEKRVQFVEYIKKSSNQLLKIIDDLLDISKLQANQVVIESQYIEIYSVLKDVYVMTKNSVKYDISKIKYVLAKKKYPDEIFIYTDLERLRQILINLAENALKYTKQGKVYLDLSFDENYMEFLIKDTGIGIPEEFHKIIFEPFTQVNNINYRSGAGLGLSIVKKLSEILNVEVRFETQTNKGTTFFVKIPVSQIVKN